jgi:hypothetical protein
MTVKELIEKLQVIEDKSQECLVDDGDNMWEISSVCEGKNDEGESSVGINIF